MIRFEHNSYSTSVYCGDMKVGDITWMYRISSHMLTTQIAFYTMTSTEQNEICRQANEVIAGMNVARRLRGGL